MPRAVDGGQRVGERRRNPDFFGFDLVELAEYGAGAVATGYGNDTLVGPALKGMIPGAGSMGQVVDAGTTLASAWVVGKVFGFMSRPLGRRMMVGGGVLAVARFFGAFVPGYSLSVTYPQFSLPGLNMRALGSGQPAAPNAPATVPQSSVAL